MGRIISEEIGRYDPYTDKFIKNTTTDRIEIGTDGNLYRLSISNGNEYLPMDRLYTKADMVAMLEDLLIEIKHTVIMEEDTSSNEDLVKRNNVIKVVQFRIDKLKENEND